jgi:hypothetical protein
MPDQSRINPSQFRVLHRVFYLRVIDLEVLSADGDTHKLMGQFAALFSAVSLVFTAPLIFATGRWPQTAAWTMEHLLIATTMVVIGVLSVLNWDSVFPDRRDILVLAPLPIPAPTLFWAKVSALAAVLGISIVALNVFTGVAWPFFFSPMRAGYLGAFRSIVAYWIAMTASGGFIFCSILSLQGVTSLVLPRQMFLRLSALLQAAVFGLLLIVYFLEPSLESIEALTAPQNQHLLAWLPSYWFLGLFQQLNGSMLPAFAPLALRAWIGFATAALLAGATLLLSYFQALRKTIEQPDILPASRGIKWAPRLGSALQTAMMMFSLRGLLRSRQHRVILSFYLGVGFAVVLAVVKNPFAAPAASHAKPAAQMGMSLVAASILVMCVVVGGIRIVSAIPIALQANWVFRLTELRGVPKYLGSVRRSFLAIGVAPVWLAFATLFLSAGPWPLVVKHLLVLALFGAILVQLCELGSRKIPFTCSYLPGKGNIQFVFWGCVMLLVRLVLEAAKLERQALDKPFRYALLVISLLAAWTILRWSATVQAKSAPALYFEDVNPAEVITLNLHRD